jgi:hypothetical protein
MFRMTSRRCDPSIVDEQDFPAPLRGDLFKDRADALDEGENRLFLVLDRDDDREERRDQAALDEGGIEIANARWHGDHRLLARLC